jgi:hypothetical protein
MNTTIREEGTMPLEGCTGFIGHCLTILIAVAAVDVLGIAVDEAPACVYGGHDCHDGGEDNERNFHSGLTVRWGLGGVYLSLRCLWLLWNILFLESDGLMEDSGRLFILEDEWLTQVFCS